jgi:hypothetical protein
MTPSPGWFLLSATSVERARCVRIIKRHIAFWQRSYRQEQRLHRQEMIAELRNILQEIQPTTGAGDGSIEEGQHAE